MSLPPESVTVTGDTMREGLRIESAAIPVDAKLGPPDALGRTGAPPATRRPDATP